MKKAIVLLSGGLDSAVCAAIASTIEVYNSAPIWVRDTQIKLFNDFAA